MKKSLSEKNTKERETHFPQLGHFIMSLSPLCVFLCFIKIWKSQNTQNRFGNLLIHRTTLQSIYSKPHPSCSKPVMMGPEGYKDSCTPQRSDPCNPHQSNTSYFQTHNTSNSIQKTWIGSQNRFLKNKIHHYCSVSSNLSIHYWEHNTVLENLLLIFISKTRSTWTKNNKRCNIGAK